MPHIAFALSGYTTMYGARGSSNFYFWPSPSGAPPRGIGVSAFQAVGLAKTEMKQIQDVQGVCLRSCSLHLPRMEVTSGAHKNTYTYIYICRLYIYIVLQVAGITLPVP